MRGLTTAQFYNFFIIIQLIYYSTRSIERAQTSSKDTDPAKLSQYWPYPAAAKIRMVEYKPSVVSCLSK